MLKPSLQIIYWEKGKNKRLSNWGIDQMKISWSQLDILFTWKMEECSRKQPFSGSSPEVHADWCPETLNIIRVLMSWTHLKVKEARTRCQFLMGNGFCYLHWGPLVGPALTGSLCFQNTGAGACPKCLLSTRFAGWQPLRRTRGAFYPVAIHTFLEAMSRGHVCVQLGSGLSPAPCGGNPETCTISN